MTINDLRPYVFLVNQGSGCIVQPTDDDGHSYILTANHVVKDTLANIQISRFQLDDKNNWTDIDIPVQLLEEGKNYFPHHELDIALIRIPKIPELNQMVGVNNLDYNREGFILSGYPQIRRDGEKSEWYRTDEKTVIKEIKGYGLREAKVPGNPPGDEIRGQSGGAIVKLFDDKIALAGIQIKMVDGQEQLGGVEFTPFRYFKEIEDHYKDDLIPILRDELYEEQDQDMEMTEVLLNDPEREFVKINIADIAEDNELKSDLIDLIRENSELVIFNHDKQEAIINECNEELFRNYPIKSIDSETRTKFRKRIGTALFKILQDHTPEAIDRIIENRMSDSIGLLLSFNRIEVKEGKDKPKPKEYFNYSPIPWEYLYYPANLRDYDHPFPLADRMVIIRQINNKKSTKTIRKRQYLSTIEVLYLVKKDFKLYDMSTEDSDDKIRVNVAIKALKSNLRDLQIDLGLPLRINFNFQTIATSEKDTFIVKDLAKTLTTTTPNVIHIAADLYEPGEEIYELVDAINKATSLVDENRLSLIILQQPAQAHRKGQYQNYDKLANVILNSTTGLPAVMTIPFTLGEESDFYTIPTFYENLMRGERISECFFKLTKTIREKECIALPMLYQKQTDFSFAGTEEKTHREPGTQPRTTSATTTESPKRSEGFKRHSEHVDGIERKQDNLQ